MSYAYAVSVDDGQAGSFDVLVGFWINSFVNKSDSYKGTYCKPSVSLVVFCSKIKVLNLPFALQGNSCTTRSC